MAIQHAQHTEVFLTQRTIDHSSCFTCLIIQVLANDKFAVDTRAVLDAFYLLGGLSIPFLRGFLGFRYPLFAKVVDGSQLRIIFENFHLVLLFTGWVGTGDCLIAWLELCKDVLNVALVVSDVVLAV